MTESDIIKKLSQWVDHNKFPYQLPNSFIYQWECDYWAMTANGETREFEIKTTRADYFNDAKKDKHKQCNGANYFYYVVPKGLITKDEVDAKYGLIYIWDTEYVEIVKKPRRLHDVKFDNWKMLCNKMYGRFKQLWRQKWIDKEITRDKYYEGFNIDLEKEFFEKDLVNPECLLP